MKMNEYNELSRAKVNPQRGVVISKNNKDGGYTIAQQVFVQEGNKQTAIFLKGAIHIEALRGLYNLRDALNESIKKEEDSQAQIV